VGCEVTWREPEVAPLNPVIVFPADLVTTCVRLREAMQSFGSVLEDDVVEGSACLFESGYIDLTNAGDSVNHLDEVAYLGNQGLSRGRYLITASARPTTEGDSRLRLTTRIEGYDGAYRLLRSRGLIEWTFVQRMSDLLQVEPIAETRRPRSEPDIEPSAPDEVGGVEITDEHAGEIFRLLLRPEPGSQPASVHSERDQVDDPDANAGAIDQPGLA